MVLLCLFSAFLLKDTKVGFKNLVIKTGLRGVKPFDF